MKRSQLVHWPLLFVTLAILTIGLINLYSASEAGTSANRPYFLSQLLWSGVAVVAALVAYLIDYRIYERLAYIFYGLVVLALVAVFFTRSIGGSHRWLDLGFFNLQPSELMKIVIVTALARFFHHDMAPREGYGIKRLIKPFAITGLPIILILLEPDLGTALMIGMIAATVILFVKVRLKTIAALVLLILIALPITWQFVLKDYQKKRVMTMVDPESDPRGSGYHRRQSIIAIGSGQFSGKGFRNGTQTQLRFLPEQHTDFIFSVWAEEQGFVGSISLLILYAAMILSGLHIASKAREKFGALLCLGLTAVIFCQMTVNIGMVLGLLPVVGVTLPFMSYGGTSLVISIMSVALMLNIYSRRHMF